MKIKLKKYMDKLIFYLYITLLFSFIFSIALRNILIGLLFIVYVLKFIIYREFNFLKNEYNFYISLFVIFSLLSFLKAENYNLALSRFVSPIFRYLFFFFITLDIINKNKINLFVNTIIYGNLIYAFLGIIIKFMGGPNYITGNGTATVAAFNIFLFTAMILEDFNIKYQKYICGFGSLSYLYILFTTNSRGAVLAFFISLFFFIGFIVYYNLNNENYKRLITIFLIILILSTPFLLPDRLIDKFDNLSNIYAHNSLKTRIVMWESAIDMTIENPILGVGVGNYRIHYLDFLDNDSEIKLSKASRQHDHPHNMFLFISSEQGIPSLVIFLIMVFISIKISLYNIFKNKPFSKNNLLAIVLLSIIVVFIIHSFFDSTARYGHVGYYILTILVINYKIYEEVSNSNEN